MRKILLSLTAASAIVAAASVIPASAMTVGTASGIQAAIADTSVLDEVAYVCRHRAYSSRRVCWSRAASGSSVRDVGLARYRDWSAALTSSSFVRPSSG